PAPAGSRKPRSWNGRTGCCGSWRRCRPPPAGWRGGGLRPSSWPACWQRRYSGSAWAAEQGSCPPADPSEGIANPRATGSVYPCSAEFNRNLSGGRVMSATPKLWVQEMCGRLAEIERETLEQLGETKGGFFVNVANDCLDINCAIQDAYPGQHNLVLHTSWGVFKEVGWFHFFFVSGNYPILLSRLRFVWESVYRAYFAENHPLGGQQPWPAPGPSPDDKLAWLDEHERDLNWDRCLEPVLRRSFPLADREAE